MKLSFRTLLFCCFIVLVAGCGKNNTKLAPGDVAGDFRLATVDHKRFYLNKHKGKVVVLIFWTTWCNFCKQEMIELEHLGNCIDRKNLVIAAICSDPESIGEVKSIKENLGITYPVLLDKGAKVAGQYKIAAFPTTIVIDREGRISFVREGYNSAIFQQIKAKVQSLASSGANSR